MALSTAERQQRYRARKKGEGWVQLLLYVTPKQAEGIRAYLQGDALPVTSNVPLSASPAVTSNATLSQPPKQLKQHGKRQRRKKPEDPRKALVEARLREIERWVTKGLKPTEIAKRLRIEGVTGAYLNGLFGDQQWWPTRRAFY